MLRSASPLKVLRGLFNIYPGEGAAVAWMVLYAIAALGFLYTVGITAGSALFLSGLPPSAVPFTFILPAIVVAPTIVVYNRLATRIPPTRLVLGSNLLMLIGMAGFRVLFETAYGDSFPVLAGFFVFNDVVASLTYLQFWNFASQTFNARQGKRLFGFIAGAGTLTTIIAGATLGAVGDDLDPRNLLFVLMVGLACCLVAAWGLGRLQGEAATPTEADDAPPSSLMDDLRALARSPLLRLIAGLVALVTIVTNIAEYQLYIGLQTAFTDNGSQMVAFLGALDFWTGLAALVVQLLVVPRVLRRFGVVAALLVLPVALGLSSGLVMVTGGALWAITLLKASDSTFNPTIDDTARKVLYLPVPAALGRQAQEFFEGVGTPIIYGLLGLVLLAMDRVPAWGLTQWSLVAVVLVAIWLLLLRHARQHYQHALAENMRKRRLDFDAEALNVSDETTAHVLTDALRQPDESLVLHALQFIPAGAAWDVQIAPLLKHPSHDVQQQALRRLGRPGNTAYADPITPLLEAGDAAVRGAAIEAWCAILGQAALPRVVPLLDEPSAAVQGAAVVGLIKYGGLDGILQAALPLKGLLTSEEPERRLEGARVLAVLQVPTFYQPLLPLLDDPDEAVQLSAIRAAGVLRVPELAPYLVRKLGHRATAAAAVEALSQYGAGIEPLLADALSDRELGPAREYVPRVLQRLATDEAVRTLLAHLEEPNAAVRTAVYRALARLRPIAWHEGEVKAIHRAILDELQRTYALYVLYADIEGEGGGSLLEEALTTRQAAGLDRIFLLLSILHPGPALASVRQALGRGVGEERARAVELLDTLIDQAVKGLLLPLIEAPREQVLDIGRKRLGLPSRPLGERLSELVRGDDDWLCCCALFRIGELHLVELSGVVGDALASEAALVRETASLAQSNLLKPATA